MNNVFVYCELEGNKVADVSLELCTKGRKLANQLGVQLEAILIGAGDHPQISISDAFIGGDYCKARIELSTITDFRNHGNYVGTGDHDNGGDNGGDGGNLSDLHGGYLPFFLFVLSITDLADPVKNFFRREEDYSSSSSAHSARSSRSSS